MDLFLGYQKDNQFKSIDLQDIKLVNMKKITLSLLFLSLGIYAQDFPDPYCDIDESGTTVE